jgi:hypothetical protein
VLLLWVCAVYGLEQTLLYTGWSRPCCYCGFVLYTGWSKPCCVTADSRNGASQASRLAHNV